MVNVEKLKKEHFIHHDLVLPHFHGYPIRVVTASCPWSEPNIATNILNVAVTQPGEDGTAVGRYGTTQNRRGFWL